MGWISYMQAGFKRCMLPIYKVGIGMINKLIGIEDFVQFFEMIFNILFDHTLRVVYARVIVTDPYRLPTTIFLGQMFVRQGIPGGPFVRVNLIRKFHVLFRKWFGIFS